MSGDDILNQIDGVISDAEGMMRWAPPGSPARQAAEAAEEWDEIHAYTRAQALEDGHLVAVPEGIAREAGFRFPIACTSTVWEGCVAWTDGDTARKGVPQDQAGRLWDVLWMARLAVRRGGDGDRSTFEVYRVDRDGDDREPQPVTLEIVCGPGDNFEPVLTIQFPGED